jgi:hypothetical protein
LGVFLAFSGYRVIPGVVLAISSAVYFVLMRFVIMPSFGTWFFQDLYFKDLVPEGANSFGGVIATMISNPAYVATTMLSGEKLRYLLQLLVPLAFLPLRRAWLVVALVPGSLFTLLTTRYAPTIDIGFQYSAHHYAYLFPAVAVALGQMRGEGKALDVVRVRAGLAALVVGTALTTFHWGAIPPRETIHGGFFDLPMTAPTEADRQKHRDLQELHKLVPRSAKLAVSEQEMTHISRLNMFSLRDHLDADYLLYGTASGFYGSDNANRGLHQGNSRSLPSVRGWPWHVARRLQIRFRQSGRVVKVAQAVKVARAVKPARAVPRRPLLRPNKFGVW